MCFVDTWISDTSMNCTWAACPWQKFSSTGSLKNDTCHWNMCVQQYIVCLSPFSTDPDSECMWDNGSQAGSGGHSPASQPVGCSWDCSSCRYVKVLCHPHQIWNCEPMKSTMFCVQFDFKWVNLCDYLLNPFFCGHRTCTIGQSRHRGLY